MIEYILKEKIAYVYFDRQDAMNALNSDVIIELSKVIEKIEKSDARAVIFTGKGKAFISGADIKEMENLRGEKAIEFTKRGRDLFRKIELLNIPTISAINGYAFGGGIELALATDIRICSQSAVFGMPEAKLGVIPGFSGTQRLPRLIGVPNAKYMILTGMNVSAQKALVMGLVSEVTENNEQLMELAEKIANKIKGNSKNATQKIKQVIEMGTQMPFDLSMEFETNYVGFCFGSEEQIEGMAAFRENRKPNFD